MKWLIIVVCLLVITAAAADLHCTALRPAPDTIIVVCRTGRF